ncbi:MAG TPA: hypothetical protein VEY71_02590 [Chitinophagales bacterium]|nr:hypothetical protein [Chitinophagales bacterium]
MSLQQPIQFDEVTSVSKKLRSRLLAYRIARKGMAISKHSIAVEMALCLVEFSLLCEPARFIKPDERIWFNAGFEVYHIFCNSEWEDIIDLYAELKVAVETVKFFEPESSMTA